MAPSPLEKSLREDVGDGARKERPLPGNEVVISGISGLFPSSESTQQFMENLYNKIDMVTFEEMDMDQIEMPKHYGRVKGMRKFDAPFFRVTHYQTTSLEPMSRKLMEHAYSAMFDAGVNPVDYKGKKVGVFIGAAYTDSASLSVFTRNASIITGISKTMLANRISYWLDGKGPSYTLDCSCTSSLVALEHAHDALAIGACDAAIVGGCNLCVHPKLTINLARMGVLCSDGKTKCFDQTGDGYVRSESINVMFLQRAQDAKRIYAEVYDVQVTYGLKADAKFLPMRGRDHIVKFLENFYSRLDVSPSEVEYVEANGAATSKADAQELEAISQVFCKKNNVMVGCVKSNMGNSEAASGMCALTKLCLAYHRGALPANLHFSQPCVRDDRVRVLSDHAPFSRGFTAVNNFSYTGVDAHVLLKGHYKPKDLNLYKVTIPRLVLVSGRQEICVGNLLDALKNQPVDPEQIGLFHSIYETETPGHTCRGYTLLDTNEQGQTVSLAQSIEFLTVAARPLCLVYSGMGSQWPTMGARLMELPIFAAAIEKCRKVLEPRGVDIVRILTEPDEAIFGNVLHSFVGIAAVQIGLTDILKTLGIVPDYVIGHSVGEIGCSYLDGSFSAEDMILAAYIRGAVSEQTDFILGKMAAVGLGYKDVVAQCPEEVDVACHNSPESSTISGPAEIVQKFVAELKARGVFAKEVASSNIAYHSRYVAHAGPDFLQRLSKIITDPKPRSSKWISTSVPQKEWDEPRAKLSSAEYFTNNLLKPVLFEEAARLIPSNAVLVEVAPHGLMQAILKRSHPQCIHIPLTRRLHPDPVQFLLEAVGKLYQEGYNAKVAMLYPRIQYPVASETPLLSHLVEWEHSEEWPEALNSGKLKTKVTPIRDIVISVHDDNYKYIAGHVRNGSVVFPEAALLCLVWETLAMYRGVKYHQLPVTFKDVHFHGEAFLLLEETLKLSVVINKGNSRFVINYKDVILTSGFIIEENNSTEFPTIDSWPTNDTDELLHRSDVYQLLQLRGFAYKDEFQSIHSSNVKASEAQVEWKDNWVTFLDSLIQLTILAREHGGISTPKFIRQLTIKTLEVEHNHESELFSDEKYYKAQFDNICGIIRCGNIFIKDIIFDDKPINQQSPDILETQSFIPHDIQGKYKMDEILQIQLQIVVDNVLENSIRVSCTSATHGIIERVTELMPTLNCHIVASEIEDLLHHEPLAHTDVLVVQNLLRDQKKLIKIYQCMGPDTFILTLEQHKPKLLRSDMLSVVSLATVAEQTAVLLKKVKCDDNEKVIFIPVTRENTFSWVPRVRSELLRMRRVVLISEQHPYCGLFGLVKRLRKEYQNKIGLIAIHDSQAPSFDSEKRFYKEQLRKNLTFNIFKKGEWGGYYTLPVTTTHSSSEANEQCSLRLTSAADGLLDTVRWTHAPCAPTDLQVCFAGPSMRDAQQIVGLIEANGRFGMDFSGIDARGTRMMGLVPSGALASRVPVEHALLWPVPAHWSLRDAATVPFPYALACYCLVLQTQLRPGQKLLVTEGAEPLGQACIALALRVGASVFVTVNDIRKKRLLLRLFPELNDNNIDYTYRGSFLTAFCSTGNLCDIVINCYSGELRKLAMKCVKGCGIFLDLNEYDIRSNMEFDMGFIEQDRIYKPVQFANVFRAENSKERKELQQLVSQGVALGWVRPLLCVELLAGEAVRALRLVASRRLSSCVLLRLPVEPASAATAPKRDGVTLLLGAEGELAAAMVERLVRHGARHLLMPKRGNVERHTFWKKLGVTIAVSSENLQTEASCLRFLREGGKLGLIRSIYIVQESSSTLDFERKHFIHYFNKTISVAVTLDVLSRNNCPELSEFVVFTHSSRNAINEYVASALEKICESRSEAGLPALALRFQNLNQLTDPLVDHPNLQLAALTGMEAGLTFRDTHIIASKFNTPKTSSLIHKITKILGVNNIDDLEESLMLDDLNVSEVNVEEVRAVIKDMYKIDYTAETLRRTSILSLKQLTNKSNTIRKDSGLSAFYSYVDQDEYMANDPMISMHTLLSITEEEVEHLGANETCLILITGFEGHHRIFKPVCERLKVRALTFQLGPDLTHHNIPQMAARAMRLVRKRCERKLKFYLLGYSFGVNVALELAAMLEKEGLIGVVYCLDSSPDALRAQLDMYVGELSDSQLQCAIVLHMYKLMADRNDDQLHRQLDQLQNWSDRVELFVNTLKRSASYTSQYARDVVKAAYSRLRLARSYEPDFKLDSEVVLVKSTTPPGSVLGILADDYNLSKYTRRPVRVFNVPADHVTVPNDCRVSNIVNSQLDPHLIDLFRNMNLCQTYLTV